MGMEEDREGKYYAMEDREGKYYARLGSRLITCDRGRLVWSVCFV